MNLNSRAAERCQTILNETERLKIVASRDSSGVQLIDLGVNAVGGLEAGRALAEICMADLARIEILPSSDERFPGPTVSVQTDQPVAACMASQYAGWEIAGEKFFAMGSGPMRAAYGGEKLFEDIGFREKASEAVGVLESDKLPPSEVCASLAEKCGVEAEKLTLLIAPTTSIAGSLQVVARSVETTLHKLHELKFDLDRIESGFGSAPLPPIAADVMGGIGRTNDAILYGGSVCLWVRGDDASLEQIGPQTPSNASKDHGQPFAEIFKQYGNDFYKIDPMLFSPAVVTLVNRETGRSHRFGEMCPEILEKSFTN